MVADDDSSMRSQLKWRIQDKINAGLISEWPTYVSVKGRKMKVACKGKLDMDVSEPSFIADPITEREF
eukprot:scaffold33481_cov48-Attheya_sp.AAC.2